MQLDHQKQYKQIATLTKSTQMITYRLCITYNKNIHCIFKLVTCTLLPSTVHRFNIFRCWQIFNISFSWHVKKCIFHFKETGPITLQQQTWKKDTKRLCKNSWNLIKANLSYYTNVHPMDRWMDNEWHTIINMPRLFLFYKKNHFILALILQ